MNSAFVEFANTVEKYEDKNIDSTYPQTDRRIPKGKQYSYKAYRQKTRLINYELRLVFIPNKHASI